MNKKQTAFSPELQERAVWLVRGQRSEHPSRWAALDTIAPIIGCTAQTLLDWVNHDKIARGVRDEVSAEEGSVSRRWSERSRNCAAPAKS